MKLFVLIIILALISLTHNAKQDPVIDITKANVYKYMCHNAEDLSDVMCEGKDNLDLFIITHKDFNNYRKNKAYKILTDDRTCIQKKYDIDVIYTDTNNELYPLKIGYCEGSKMYWVWKNYYNQLKDYVGFNHYRRIFAFNDNIPNLDEIFKEYDVILRPNVELAYLEHFKKDHCLKAIEEVLEIMKEKYPDYYETAMRLVPRTKHYLQNLFIMKKEDFKIYGEFVFSILREWDRRNNITNDDEMLKWTENAFNKKYITRFNSKLQRRMQGILLERLSSIFYQHHFKKPFIIEIQFGENRNTPATSMIVTNRGNEKKNNNEENQKKEFPSTDEKIDSNQEELEIQLKKAEALKNQYLQSYQIMLSEKEKVEKEYKSKNEELSLRLSRTRFLNFILFNIIIIIFVYQCWKKNKSTAKEKGYSDLQQNDSEKSNFKSTINKVTEKQDN